jgi:hypothetical protein
MSDEEKKYKTIEPWQLILMILFSIAIWEGIKDGCSAPFRN